jgi:hypothetical protein
MEFPPILLMLLILLGTFYVTVPVLIGGRATDAGVQARVAEAAR